MLAARKEKIEKEEAKERAAEEAKKKVEEDAKSQPAASEPEQQPQTGAFLLSHIPVSNMILAHSSKTNFPQPSRYSPEHLRSSSNPC